jgi:hypothetical protein
MTAHRPSVIVAGTAARNRRWVLPTVLLLTLELLIVGFTVALVLADRGDDTPRPTRPLTRAPIARLEPTRSSAVQAAVDALYALSVPAITDRRRFAASVQRLAAPGAAEHVKDVFGDTDPAVVAAFRRQPSVLRGAPLGYRIDRFENTSASIAIWSVAIAAASGERARSQWRTLVIDVVWTPNGWRVTSGAGVDGPAPSTAQRELATEAAGFRSFRHVP